jgi:glycosyltransferase involved in cell wall biosynthesis
MRILALTKYGPAAASTRQRFLQYCEPLAQAGFDLHTSALLDDRHVENLVAGRKTSKTYALDRYVRRVGAILGARRFDLLWLHCELFPYLPGWIERFGAELIGRPIIFDNDDAIYHPYDAHRSPLVRTLLGRKLEPLLAEVSAVTCGNVYLRDYASRFCPRSIVVPTSVDTTKYVPNPARSGEKLVIGWIGSPSTWENVRPIFPVLQELCASGNVSFRAIGAGIAADGDIFPGLELVPWSEASEISDIQSFDIGIMPLIDEPFQRGKSGYKLVQYMACCVPSVASPVGVNRQMLAGDVGILARDAAEWKKALETLLNDRNLRRRMGDAGRLRAERHYSVAAQAPRLVALFREVTG